MLKAGVNLHYKFMANYGSTPPPNTHSQSTPPHSTAVLHSTVCALVLVSCALVVRLYMYHTSTSYMFSWGGAESACYVALCFCFDFGYTYDYVHNESLFQHVTDKILF